jgi:hypothetical protein
MLNSPYTSSAMSATALPALLTTVSSTSYSMQQSFTNNPQFGAPGQQPGVIPGLPNSGYGPQSMGFPQAVPYGVGMPMAGGYPTMMPQPIMQQPPMPGQLYYQPARMVTNVAQTVYRTYIPPSVSAVPPYPVPQGQPALYGQAAFAPRWV